MRCASCHGDNPDGFRFCGSCGAALVPQCPACGAAGRPGDRFCGHCGTAIDAPGAPPSPPGTASAPDAADAPAGELRQTTILFADLCGFTELSAQREPEEMQALLDRFFEAVDEAVADYGGSIDKHIGDNVMAIFGAPVAHDDDPLRAAHAALKAHRVVGALGERIGVPLALHIGLASGRVMASGTGSARHRTYTVTGDSVNLASRLQAMAKPGETLVSEGVRRAIEPAAELESLGTSTVKGFGEPVPVWRLLRLGDARAAPRTPFVGRRRELRQVEGLLDACLADGVGQSLQIRAEAGMGKTRLIEEARRLAGQRGFAWHEALILDFGAGRGRDAAGALARSFLSVPADAEPRARAGALETALSDALLQADEEIFARDLLDLAQPPALKALFDGMDNQARRDGRRRILATMLSRLAAGRPRVVCVEDLHWAEAGTLDQIAALGRAVADCPAVMLLTKRAEGEPIDGVWRSGSVAAPLSTLDLGPLPPAEAEALATSLCRDDAEMRARCLARAEGNPLFLDQLLRSAVEGGAGEAVPGSIHSLVLARMDRLPAPDRRAVQAAAVVGQRFDRETLCRLLEAPDYDCRTLIDQQFVRPQGRDFLFAHALVRQGVYDSLTRAQRRALHRRAADHVGEGDPVLRAEHLERAEDPEAPAALLVAAGSEAGAYRYESALRLCERGLVPAAERAVRYALICQQADLLRELGRPADSLAAFETALSLADDAPARCRAWIGQVAAMRLLDRYDDALAVLEQAEAAATAAGHEAALAEIHYFRGNIYFPLGQVERCTQAHEAALAAARRCGDSHHEARALSGLGDADYLRGRMASAQRHYDRCIALARRHGFALIEAANLHMRGLSLFYQNRLSEGLEDCRTGADAAARLGHRRAEVAAAGAAGYLLVETDDLAAARAAFERAQRVAREIGARRFEAQNLLFLGKVLARQGEPAPARARLEQALAISRETGVAFAGAMALGALALVVPEARTAALAEGEAILAAGCVSHNYFWFYRDAAEAALAAGDWDAAARYGAALEAYTRAEPLAWSDFHIARARALADVGRGRRDAALRQTLEGLAATAREAGLLAPLPAIERALADIASAAERA